ncbi:MAG: hypothetical protein ACK4GN_04925 [Runella sp.]
MLSCKQNPTGISPDKVLQSQTNFFTIEDGRINFANAASFEQQIRALQGLSDEELTKWNAQTKIESLFKIQRSDENKNARASGEVPENDNGLSEFVNDPYFASLINKDGEISIGKQVVWITPDVVFIADKSKLSEMKKLAPLFCRLKPHHKPMQIGVCKLITDTGLVKI